MVMNPAVRVEDTTPPAPRRPLGHLPLWGGAAAFLAAWAAYARRKRLQRAIEEARERTARAARLAAQRARAAALMAAVARSLAKRKQGQGKDDDKGEDPPHPRRIPITLDGEVPLDQAASGRTPQPGPTRPDGSYTPHGLRDAMPTRNPLTSPHGSRLIMGRWRIKKLPKSLLKRCKTLLIRIRQRCNLPAFPATQMPVLEQLRHGVRRLI